MSLKKIPYKNIIKLKKNKLYKNIYDVEMSNNEQLKKFSSVECHIVIYPFSRKICSKDISFYPFEEYVKDIQAKQRSAYYPLKSHFDKLFGIFLGLAIILGFYFFYPKALFSVESIISIIGAYFIGKELWDDIEKILIRLTRKWKIRYQENYYLYKLEKNTTLTFYSHLAKKNRYGKSSLLPEKIDFIQQSNSQTLRMKFNRENFKHNNGSVMHMISIHIDEKVISEFVKKGFMFGIKLSFNKSIMGFTYSKELFQSINIDKKGCIDKSGRWIPESIFYRNISSIGRIKLFITNGIYENKCMIKI